MRSIYGTGLVALAIVLAGCSSGEHSTEAPSSSAGPNDAAGAACREKIQESGNFLADGDYEVESFGPAESRTWTVRGVAYRMADEQAVNYRCEVSMGTTGLDAVVLYNP